MKNKIAVIVTLALFIGIAATSIKQNFQNASTVNFTVDTSAYAVNDRLGSKFMLRNVGDAGGYVALRSLQVIDTAGQGAAFDILLFNDEPAVDSADNASLDISDDELLNKFVGAYSVTAANYGFAANGSTAHVSFTENAMKLKQGSTGLWGVLRSKGTPTYGSTTSLNIKFEFLVY